MFFFLERLYLAMEVMLSARILCQTQFNCLNFEGHTQFRIQSLTALFQTILSIWPLTRMRVSYFQNMQGIIFFTENVLITWFIEACGACAWQLKNCKKRVSWALEFILLVKDLKVLPWCISKSLGDIIFPIKNIALHSMVNLLFYLSYYIN